MRSLIIISILFIVALATFTQVSATAAAPEEQLDKKLNL